MYNFNHLYYFYITAKSGGVTAAAKHLRISQPSLSSQLKALEQALDKRLFQKVGRRNELTENGAVIYGLCRNMFEISEEMEELISKRVPSASRWIHIGVSDEVERSFVFDVVSLFLKEHGLIQRPKVTVNSGTHEQLIERLRFHELDVVVTPFAMTDPDLENLECAEVPVGLICPSKWKVSSNTEKLKAADAVKKIFGGEYAQWLMPSSRFKLRSQIDLFFEENKLKGRVVFESDMMASIVRAIADEVGLAFLPLLYVSREISEKSVRVLGPKAGYWKYRVWLGCHGQNKNDKLIQTLSTAFKKTYTRANR
ncbi:MAG: LysR family transcriptional regulator [bacterium]